MPDEFGAIYLKDMKLHMAHIKCEKNCLRLRFEPCFMLFACNAVEFIDELCEYLHSILDRCFGAHIHTCNFEKLDRVIGFARRQESLVSVASAVRSIDGAARF